MRWYVMLLLAGCGFHPGALARDDGGTGPTADSAATDADAASIDAPGADAGSAASCTLPPNVNVDPGTWAATFASAPVWRCAGSGTTTIDSQQGTIDNGCAAGITMTYVVTEAGGGPVLAIPLRGLSVTSSHVLKLAGDKPIVFLVAGDVVVDTGGMIDASASGATPGPGALDAAGCGNGTGGAASLAGWGGGGGAFGTAGGDGGYNVENGGAANGDPGLKPLRGGCPGGSTMGSTTAGAGGGAFEISASGTISIGATGAGLLVASGGGAPATNGGGNGGGAGGGILLVSPVAATFGAGGVARAHGGAGSSGNNAASSGGPNLPGMDGHAMDDNAATDTSGNAGQGVNFGNDDGRVGGLAYDSASGLTGVAGALHPKTTNGRGGGGGGGGRIVITAKAAGPSCD